MSALETILVLHADHEQVKIDIRLDKEREQVTSRGGTFFALCVIQTLFVVKYPLLTHVKPGVKLHTKACHIL